MARGDVSDRGKAGSGSSEGRSARGGSRGELARRHAPMPGMRGAYARDPFTLMRSMVEDMNRMMGDLWPGPGLLAGRRGWAGLAGTWLPEVEVRRTADGLQVTADLPGLRREDIDIELLDGALRISGERGMEHQEEQEGVLRSERRYGRFERVIPLPEGVDEEAVTARFADGVLEVTVPLPKEAMKARKIEVR